MFRFLSCTIGLPLRPGQSTGGGGGGGDDEGTGYGGTVVGVTGGRRERLWGDMWWVKDVNRNNTSVSLKSTVFKQNHAQVSLLMLSCECVFLF